MYAALHASRSDTSIRHWAAWREPGRIRASCTLEVSPVGSSFMILEHRAKARIGKRSFDANPDQNIVERAYAGAWSIDLQYEVRDVADLYEAATDVEIEVEIKLKDGAKVQEKKRVPIG